MSPACYPTCRATTTRGRFARRIELHEPGCPNYPKTDAVQGFYTKKEP